MREREGEGGGEGEEGKGRGGREGGGEGERESSKLSSPSTSLIYRNKKLTSNSTMAERVTVILL